MNFDNVPTSVILFFVGQTATAAWAIITMYFDIKTLKQKHESIIKENEELKHQLKDLSDTLLIVKNNTELLVLGKLKTGQK
jgi:cell division protein FtsB